MFKKLLDFGYKRTVLEAILFCIFFYLVGMVVALSMGALEFFLFGGHKFKHVISGGRLIAIVEVWILSYLIINAKRLYKDPISLLLMILASALCLVPSIGSWILIGALTTLSPRPLAQNTNNRMASTLFRSAVILIPVGFLVYDFMFIGVVPAIGIESAKTLLYRAKNPDASKRWNEINDAKNAFVKVRFKKTQENALRGYEFAMACAKYEKYYNAKNLLDEININDLDPNRREKARIIRSYIQEILDRPDGSLGYYASEIDRGYANVNERSARFAKEAGNNEAAAEFYMNALETIGGNTTLTSFDLVEVFKKLKQYKNAIYLIDEALKGPVSEVGLKKYNAQRQELILAGPGSAEDGKYFERYEKFKDYREQYREAKKIKPESDPKAAEEATLRVLQKAPTIVDQVRTRIYLAHIYQLTGQYDKALEEIRWLKDGNLEKVNDRMVKYLDGYEWEINRYRNGKDKEPDPVKEEINRLIGQ